MSAHSHQPRNGRLEQQSPSDRSSSCKGDLAVNSGSLEIKNGISAANVVTLSHPLLGAFISPEKQAGKRKRKAEIALFSES